MRTESLAATPADTNNRSANLGRWFLDWTRDTGWKHLLLGGFGVIMIYPLLYMLTGSFMHNQRFATEFNGEFTLANYVNGWFALGVPFGRFLFNSMVVSILSIIGNLVSCALAAYAFARLDFPFRRSMFALMLATIMLPFHVTIIPQYIMFNTLGLVNTYVPLILPKFLAVDAFFVFLMVQFMRGIPSSLDEAAQLDGCGPFQTFFFVILPLCVPALGVTAVFTFIWTWNDFFTPLLFLNTPELYTVPLGLSSFKDSSGLTDYGALFAMSILSLLPVFVVFFIAQKALVEGIATTGLK